MWRKSFQLTITKCLTLCNNDKSCVAVDMDDRKTGLYECWGFKGTLKNLHTLCDGKCSGEEKCYAKLGLSSMFK